MKILIFIILKVVELFTIVVLPYLLGSTINTHHISTPIFIVWLIGISIIALTIGSLIFILCLIFRIVPYTIKLNKQWTDIIYNFLTKKKEEL